MVILSSFEYPESPVRLELANVNVLLDGNDLGTGSLYISERTVAWNRAPQFGFCLDYGNIALHAITRDPEVHRKECVYIHTDPRFALTESVANDGGQDSDSDSEVDLSVLILVPEDESQVKTIYDAIKDCQVLNPDEEALSDMEQESLSDMDEAEDGEEANEGGQHIPLLNIARIMSDSFQDEMNGLLQRFQNNSVRRPSSSDDEFQDAD